jgi:hypothetical protein
MPPGEVFTVAPPGAPHLALPPACNHTKISLGEAPLASEREAGEDWSSVVAEGVKSRAGSSHGSPRRGGGQRNYLVEVEEGAAASISPKVATAKVTGAGRNRQATAAANQIARGTTREREGGDWGWAGSV